MTDHDRGEFALLLEDWAAAIVADDPETIGQFATPDWVLVGEAGIFPRERFLASVASGDLTHEMMSFEVHDVRIYGEVAVVIARGRNRGAFRGEPFQLDEWTTEVFVRRDGFWKGAVTHLAPATADAPPSSG